MAAPQLSDRLLTAEEFFELPDPPEGGKMELICGKVVRRMPVSGEHAELTIFLIEQLGPFVRRTKIGKMLNEAGHLLGRDPDMVRAPDISFVANNRLPPAGLPKNGFVPIVPTLAIEVVSPNDLDSEIAAKVEDYLAAGVERVWVVLPKQRTVTIHYPDGTARRVGAGGALTSDDAGFAVAGFELRLDELFAD